MGIPCNNFSTLARLVRISVLCLKFIRLHVWSKLPVNSKVTEDINKNHPLLAFTINKLSAIHFFHIQRCTASHDALGQRGSGISISAQSLLVFEVSSQTSLQYQLGLHIDDMGIIRSRGRLKYAASHDRPLLPRHCWFTYLVIRDAHSRVLHAGNSPHAQ